MNVRNDYLVLLFALSLELCLGTGCSRETSKNRHLERANQFFKADQFDKAWIEYLNVLQSEPTNSLAFRNLGLIAYNRGDFRKAFPLLNKTKESSPQDLEVRLKLALILQSIGENNRAREEANFILDRTPTNEEAVLILSDTAVMPEEIKATQQRLEELRRKGVNHAAFHIASGTMALRQQDLKTAESAFQQALALNPGSSAAHLALGNLYWLQNNLPRAEVELRTAADLAPARSPRRLALVDFKVRTSAVDEAKALLTEMTRKTPDFLPAWNYLAKISVSERKYDDGSALIQTILARDPANAEALSLRTQLRMVQGDFTKAVEELERLIALYPRAAPLRYQLAVACLLNKDLGRAVNNLNQAMVLDPNFTDSVLLLAELSIRKGDPASAITSLADLVRRKPNLANAQVALASAYQAAGRPDDAVRVYRRLEQNSPNNAQAPFLLGLAFRLQQKLNEARRSFERVLELAPDYLPAVYQLIELDLVAKDSPAALQRAQKQIDKHPKDAGAMFLLAKVHLAENSLDQAEEALLKVIDFDQGYRSAYMLLANIYVANKKLDQALLKLEGVLAKSPKDVGALMMSGVVRSLKGEYHRAKDAYEALLEIDPQFYAALNNLAYLYAEHLGNAERAYELARKARDLRPDDPATADTFGWILLQRGEYSWALSVLQDSAQKLSSDPEVLFHLGMAHYMMGEEVSARDAFDRALKLSSAFPRRDEAERRLAFLNLNPASADQTTIVQLEKRLAEQPGDPIALNRLAAIHERAGALDKAAGAYEKAIKANPKDVATMVKLAQLYAARLHNAARALQLAREARKLAPNNAQIAHLIGRLVYQAGDYTWSLSLLQESARNQPDQPEVFYDLALSQYSLGRVTDAQTAMKAALQISSQFPHAEAARQFGEMTRLAADPTTALKAASQAEKLLKAEPDYVPALMLLASARERQKEEGAAIQIYEKILARFPDFTPALRKLAILYSRQGTDDKRAYELAVKARQRSSDDAELALAMGVIVYRRGDFARSIQLLKEGSSKQSNEGELYYYLGMAHYRLKELTQSKAALQRALVLSINDRLAGEARRVLTELKVAD